MKKEIIATDRNNEEGELPGESEVDLKARILAYTQNMSTNKYCVVYCTVCETINTLSTEYSPAHQYFNTACAMINTLNTKQLASDKNRIQDGSFAPISRKIIHLKYRVDTVQFVFDKCS